MISRMKLKQIRIALAVLALFTLPMGVQAQVPPQLEPSGTALEQGLWWLYHLEYSKARELFDQYTSAHPQDPSGYFYKTAADWWQLAQQFDADLPEVRQRLEEDYQATVKVADELMHSTKDPKIKAQACLYSGGAQGLKGRWLVTQKAWIKAYFLGKSGHKLLKRALKYDPELYDAYMGLGIYDYFTDTLPGVQKVLASLLIRGDRKRGIEELHLAIDKAQHARVEAMMFLIEIYTWEEKMPDKSLPLSDALRQEFPKSPAMMLAHIMNLYAAQQWGPLEELAKDYLARSEKETPYYKHEGAFPAHYCLGISALWGRHDTETCQRHMQEILAGDKESSRWVTFAHLRMGQIYDVHGEREKALESYKKVLSRPDFWGSQNEAQQFSKKPFQF